MNLLVELFLKLIEIYDSWDAPDASEVKKQQLFPLRKTFLKI